MAIFEIEFGFIVWLRSLLGKDFGFIVLFRFIFFPISLEIVFLLSFVWSYSLEKIVFHLEWFF